jgi:hypothetical protein
MNRRAQSITWVRVSETLPDCDMAILLDYDGEAWPGSYQGDGIWLDLTGMPIVAQVLHWAEFPEVP